MKNPFAYRVTVSFLTFFAGVNATIAVFLLVWIFVGQTAICSGFP